MTRATEPRPLRDVPGELQRADGVTAAGPFAVQRCPPDGQLATQVFRPVHVAYCLDSMAASGGTESNAVRTAEALDPAAVQLTVFAMRPDGPMRDRYAAAGIDVVGTPPVSTLVSPHTARQVFRFARVLRRQQIDVVHCHDTYTNWFAGLAARAARLPLLTSKRWIDGRRKNLLLSRLAYRMSTRVLANSGGVAQTLVRSDGVPDQRIVVVPNFVEDDAFTTPRADEIGQRRAGWGIDSLGPVVGCVARLRPEKGQATLLRAAARLVDRWPNLTVVLVGDGPEETALRALAAELGVADRVCFTGHQPNRPNPHVLFDISVLASDHEGFPNTIVEAMAAGRPVVASNVGGVPDAVRHQETGLLTPARDPGAVASAIARLLERPNWAAALGARGRDLARQQFTRTPVLDQLTALYRELAGPNVITPPTLIS